MVHFWFPSLLGLFALVANLTHITAGPLPQLTPIKKAPTPYLVQTSLGPPQGVASGTCGAARWTVPYAAPPIGGLRFANPQPPTKFNGTYDATKTPPSCYGLQGARGGNPMSEDCLYATVYAPANANGTSKLGVLVWIPGGSFIGGSATATGLDASALAAGQNVVVVVVQYRLGLFGWFQNRAVLDEVNGGAPNASKVAGNQAVRDVVAALSFVQSNIAAFGGDPNAVTLAGQSSGAHLIRALLTTPAASKLFARAALFSDPQDYGMANATQAATITNYALEGINCSTLACARSKSADDILGATLDAFNNVPTFDPSMPMGEPFRPVLGTYIPRSLERGAAGKTITLDKPLLLATVKNEAGSQVGTLFNPSAAGSSTMTLRANGYPLDLPTAASLAFNAGRGYAAAQKKVYAFNATRAGVDALRGQLELIASDGLWRCAVQTNAINAQKIGAQVWLAQTNLGSTYPSNSAIDYCQKPGIVCHEDDILLLFGTLPGSAPAGVRAVSAEWQARLGAFVRTGSPNDGGRYGGWNALADSSALNLLVLGANTSTGASAIQQKQRKGVCGPSSGLWGQSVLFDWQYYKA